MKNKLVLIATFSVLFLTYGMSQSKFTPYDELPTLSKNNKPAYQDNLPFWAAAMYKYPVDIKAAKRSFEQDKTKTKNAYFRYFKQWLKAMEPYADTNGNIVIPEYKHKVNQQNTQNRADSLWKFLGPKNTYWLTELDNSNPHSPCPWQVNVYSMDVAKSSPNVLYCGTETGYVSRSDDKGISWSLLNQDYDMGGGITAIAVHPLDANKVWAAAGRQMHYSQNGGSTWSPLFTTNNFNADVLTIHPVDHNTIFACSADGLFISINGGQSWQIKHSAQVYDISIKPNNANEIIALTVENGFFSIIKSSNKGDTWAKDNIFPTTYKDQSGGLLATTPHNPDLAMAILLSSDDTPYLMKGGFGTAWTQKAKGKTTAFQLDNWQGYYDLGFEISPTNENVILVGTGALYKSTNGGTSFTLVGGYGGSYEIHPDVQAIKMLDNGDTYIATDGGLNYTTDNFTNKANYFVRTNGIIGSDFWGFDQGWNEDIVVGGRYHNGNTAIADFYGDKALRMGGAESPTGWVLQGKSRHVVFDDLGSGYILPSDAASEPEGRFLFTKHPNMEEYGGRRGNLFHHPNYFNTLYIGQGNSFWKSEDGGKSWEMLHTFGGQILYTNVAYSQPDVMYADVVDQGLHKSEDGGYTWQPKPSLTSTYGGNDWKGKTFFVISPNDGNVIYACLQNGTWSDDLGKVFKSTDGGNTWSNITFNLGSTKYMKNLMIQPARNGGDLVYLFCNSNKAADAEVFVLSQNANQWQKYDLGLPKGFSTNIGLPFFRDSKIRVSGNGGVWEAPMMEPDFQAIVNPWVSDKIVSCLTDTVYLEDHSMVNHAGASWQWSISPAPSFIENTNIRNPKVVFGNIGDYDITLTLTKEGKTFTKTLQNAVNVRSCPSVNDCSNPDWVSKTDWSLLYADSEEKNDPGLAKMAFDGNPSTIWHTAWTTGDAPYPHEIQIDLNEEYNIFDFEYQTRTDGVNGRIKNYDLYLSLDKANWGAPIKTGSFEDTAAPQNLNLGTNGVEARYMKLVAKSEVNGGPWASAAELSIKACLLTPSGTKDLANTAKAYPLPFSESITIHIPNGIYTTKIYSVGGQEVLSQKSQVEDGTCTIHASTLPSGLYILHLVEESSKTKFVVKMVKN